MLYLYMLNGNIVKRSEASGSRWSILRHTGTSGRPLLQFIYIRIVKTDIQYCATNEIAKDQKKYYIMFESAAVIDFVDVALFKSPKYLCSLLELALPQNPSIYFKYTNIYCFEYFQGTYHNVILYYKLERIFYFFIHVKVEVVQCIHFI